MRSVNKVILIGNLTRDPEIRQTTTGQNIATFGLATNRQWTTSSGEKKASAEFHECVAWAKLAEICEKYLHKGKLIYVEGYLKTRSWDTEEGVRKFKTEIVVEDMIMLSAAPRSGDSAYEPNAEAEGEGARASESEPSAAEGQRLEPAAPEPEPSPPPSSDENPIEKDLGL
jgi:single-strand DNA-binding protein